MKNSKSTLFAGIAALALIGSAGLAAAHVAPTMHTMTVKMPDGGLATIEYSGNVAPDVTFGHAPMPAAFFGVASPFAAIDNISAEMNREMNTLLRQADMLRMPMPASNPLYNATLQGAPGTANSYSVVETMAGNHVCAQSMQMTRDAQGKTHVVRHTSGNCSGAAGLMQGAADASPEHWHSNHGLQTATGHGEQEAQLPVTREIHFTPQ